MYYQVQYGDSLRGLARRYYGDPNRWTEIADVNHLSPVVRLMIGDIIQIPGVQTDRPLDKREIDYDYGALDSRSDRRATASPGRGFLFIVADEINPLTRKVVRRVAVPVDVSDAKLLEKILNPERYGFAPRDPASAVSVGRHVGQNMTNSRFISASERAFGSPRFPGDAYWIDVDRVIASGGSIVEAEEIARDIDRLLAKVKNPDLIARLKAIQALSRDVDKEILIEGAIPATAVKGAGAMALTRGFQFVEGVGILLTVYDLEQATRKSIELHSARPIAVETGKQAAGWGGALAGARIGAMAGAALGVETGPGAVLSAAAGAFIFGTAGYFGAEWISRMAPGGH